IKGDEVYFSEVSPRPHDTGLVTLLSQDLSEFALHARAILGLPIPVIRQNGYCASAVILVEGEAEQPVFGNLERALAQLDVHLRLVGKPERESKGSLGEAHTEAESVEEARARDVAAASAVTVTL